MICQFSRGSSWALLAGFIGNKLVNKTGEGVVLDIVLGIVGAVVGGFLFNRFGASGVMGLNLIAFSWRWLGQCSFWLRITLLGGGTLFGTGDEDDFRCTVDWHASNFSSISYCFDSAGHRWDVAIFIPSRGASEASCQPVMYTRGVSVAPRSQLVPGASDE
jgi:uncharacterized membrane protein YeaQ/YmgE (transglycosylase-associated protein family)